MPSQHSTLRTIPVLAVRASHYAILFFIMLGWAFAQKGILIFHMVMIPLVILQWKINHGRCLLTDLEHHLMPTEEDQTDNESEGFVARILRTLFKIELTPTQLMNFIYAVMAVSFIISLIKVCIL